MDLKTFTLFAIIGNSIALAVNLLLRTGNGYGLPTVLMENFGLIHLVAALLGEGTLILFLIALYAKQK